MRSVDVLLMLPPYKAGYPPIVLATLAGTLRNQGRRVQVLDAPTLGLNHRQVAKAAAGIDPAEIWLSVPFTEMAGSSKAILGLLAKFRDRIKVGGHHVDVCPSEYTGYAADNIVINAAPAWDLMPVDRYDMTMYLTTGERALPVQSSCGCPYACAFCTNSIRHQPVTNRDTGEVLDEMERATRDYGIRGFHFWDETFTLNNNRVAEICKEIIKRKMNIVWSCQTRAGITPLSIFTWMRQAGCVRISFGIESGNKQVLESINKRISLNDAVKDVAACKRLGIVTYAGYMIGHARDTLLTVCDTIRFSRQLGTDYAGFRIAIPYPGSVFRQQAEQSGQILTNNWNKYRDDAVVYVPEGLQGVDIRRLKSLAEAYFREGR